MTMKVPVNLAMQAKTKDKAGFHLIAYTDLVEHSQETIEDPLSVFGYLLSKASV